MQQKKFLVVFSLPLIFLIAWLALASVPSEFQPEPVVADEPPFPKALDLKLIPPVMKPDSNETITKMAWPKPSVVKGIYLTGWMAGSTKWFPRLVSFVGETEVNAMVIDVKDDTGTLSYQSQVPLVNKIKSFEKKISDPHQMIQVLKEHQIFPIARIVVFKDPYLAKQKPEWAVKDIDGGLWSDRKGLHWVDPHNKQLWDYIIEIAKEAINIGFQEIQFDYVRFTSDGDIKRCVYPYSYGKPHEDVIEEFLSYAQAKLKPYQVPISADIFGLTTSAAGDMGIGQNYEKIISNVDIVCPMVYPSHYAPGSFGYSNPNTQIYGTVYRAVSDAKKRLDQAGNTTTIIRPWLQDFNLGAVYGRSEIKAQIKAVNDAGLTEWIFWNPNCRYQIEKYK